MEREINGRVRPPSAVEHGWRLTGSEARELLADTTNFRFKGRATWLHGYPLTMRRRAAFSIHCDDSPEKFSSNAGIRPVLPLLHCDGPMKPCVAQQWGEGIMRTLVDHRVVLRSSSYVPPLPRSSVAGFAVGPRHQSGPTRSPRFVRAPSAC